MIAAAVLALGLQAAAPPPQQLPDRPQFRGQGQMAIFDMVCGRVFPDEARIATAMARIPGTRPLPPDEVRTYLKDDPGRGWIMPAGSSQIVVTIEAPPIRSCAVRITNTDGVIDDVDRAQRVGDDADAHVIGVGHVAQLFDVLDHRGGPVRLAHVERLLLRLPGRGDRGGGDRGGRLRLAHRRGRIGGARAVVGSDRAVDRLGEGARGAGDRRRGRCVASDRERGGRRARHFAHDR